ncbi:Myc-type, basic helix-loop-helix domain-containing protein [Tanacetum coccineum]
MQKGDKKQQEPLRTSEEIAETFWPVEALHTSHESIHEAGNYFDVIKVLSEVELPSPSPVLATAGTLAREINVTTFHEGQSSGTKRKADDTERIEHKVNAEREREQKTKQHHYVQHGHQRVATEINSTTDKLRRRRISERIRALKALLPNCNKRDKASILGDAIEYIKYLQMQVQMMQSTGVSPAVSQVPYMFQARQPSLQEQNISPYFTTRPLINAQYGMPQLGSYAPINFHLFPQSFFGYPQFMLPMQFGNGSFSWQQPRPFMYPQQL